MVTSDDIGATRGSSEIFKHVKSHFTNVGHVSKSCLNIDLVKVLLKNLTLGSMRVNMV